MTITLDTAVSLYVLVVAVLGALGFCIRQYFTMQKQIEKLVEGNEDFKLRFKEIEVKEDELNKVLRSMSENILKLQMTLDFYFDKKEKQ